MTLSLVFDIAFAVLLMITIGYAAMLNRKLGNLRRHKEELERLATTFIQSTSRAEDSIQRLKGSTDILQKGIEKAQGLRDDLNFLIERGALTADRLEEGVRGARKKSESSRPTMPGVVRRPVEPVETISDVIAVRRGNQKFAADTLARGLNKIEDDDDNDKSQAERDLIEALRQVR